MARAQIGGARMLVIQAVLLACFASPAPSFAQSQASPPKFEVAAVRPCKPANRLPGGERGTPGANPPEHLRIVCQTIERFIQMAYVTYADGRSLPVGVLRAADQPIEGGPSWVKKETFTIEAKPESPQTLEMMRG